MLHGMAAVVAVCLLSGGAQFGAAHPGRGSVGGCPGGDVCVSGRGGIDGPQSGVLEPEYFSGPQTCHMVAFEFDRVYDAAAAPVRAYVGPDCTGAAAAVSPHRMTAAHGRSFTIG
jgi:hypothetical protein